MYIHIYIYTYTYICESMYYIHTKLGKLIAHPLGDFGSPPATWSRYVKRRRPYTEQRGVHLRPLKSAFFLKCHPSSISMLDWYLWEMLVTCSWINPVTPCFLGGMFLRHVAGCRSIFYSNVWRRHWPVVVVVVVALSLSLCPGLPCFRQWCKFWGCLMLWFRASFLIWKEFCLWFNVGKKVF